MENVFKALSETTRLELFLLINASPKVCLCDLEYGFDLSISNLSRHLKELDNVGLISATKKGKWKYYSITNYGQSFVSFINSHIGKSLQKQVQQKLQSLKDSQKCCPS